MPQNIQSKHETFLNTDDRQEMYSLLGQIDLYLYFNGLEQARQFMDACGT
jgi:hypothetical protein